MNLKPDEFEMNFYLRLKQTETLRVELENIQCRFCHLIEINVPMDKPMQLNAFKIMACLPYYSRPRQQTSTIIAIISFVCFLTQDINQTHPMLYILASSFTLKI